MAANQMHDTVINQPSAVQLWHDCPVFPAIAPRSPLWHRAQRKARHRTRKAIWKRRKAGSAFPPQLLARISKLQRHHSAPVYREMAWQGFGHQPNGWDNWAFQTPQRRPPKYPKFPKKGNNQGSNDAKKPQETRLIGFDGKAVQLSDQGSWRGQPSSSSASSAEAEVATLKSVLKEISTQNGLTLTSDLEAMLASSPREAVRVEQRELNQKRKRLNKLRGLETKLKENEAKYEAWLEKQKALVKQERARYEEEQKKLRTELEQLRSPPEEENMEDPEDDLFGEPAHRDHIAEAHRDHIAEERILRAEKQAADAQQGMLMVQQQLHQQMYQFAAYFGQLQAGGPMATPMEPSTPLPGPTEVPPGHTPAPMMSTAPAQGSLGSPQLPRHVRNPQVKDSKAALKQNQQNVRHARREEIAKKAGAEVVPASDEEELDSKGSS
eukprot:Skav236531  [mRNA]  locus=scaffold78:1081100:1082612:- [translate_table: standard]